jgi:tRNA threonylcarbamoyladenosine modification (KEOPS) complex Cgi121 subunit
MVTGKDVWEQKQIKRAIELGIGKGKGEIELLTGEGEGNFNQLIRKIKEYTGL